MSQKLNRDAGNTSQRNAMIAVIVAVVALAVAFVLISAFQANQIDDNDYAGVAQSRTDDGAFVLGDPAAPVTVVVFEDFQCPHCQDYQSTVHSFIDESVRTGQARLEFRMMPVFGARSEIMFSMAECSEELRPQSFWTAHDTLFSLSGSVSAQQVPRRFAEEMDLDYNQLLTCSTTADQYDKDSQFAQANNLTFSTPQVRYIDPASGQLRQIINRAGVPTAAELIAFVRQFQTASTSTSGQATGSAIFRQRQMVVAYRHISAVTSQPV